MGVTLFSGQARVSRGRDWGGNSSIQAIGVNVHRGSGLIMSRLYGVRFVACTYTRYDSGKRGLIVSMGSIGSYFFGVRRFAPGERSDLGSSIATTLY